VQLTRAHRILIGIVSAGALLIATLGFVGSYAAVRDLAEEKGFGGFAPFFPIGVDAGIIVLLALDLLLTWLRIPFPLLRQTAWLLTAATIAFNGASAWGDPLGVGMHAIIPVLFVITVEAARHAIGRFADITADRHMEGVRAWRWLLSPIPTFRLWRRMKLWELRSYEEVIRLERDRLIYQARLRAEYGRAWRRRAPVEARMPLKLARYGVPLHQAAADVDPAAIPPATSSPSRQSPLPPPQPAVATPAPGDPTTAWPEPPGTTGEWGRLSVTSQGGNAPDAGGNGNLLHDGPTPDYHPADGNSPGNEQFLVATGASSAEQPRGRRLDVRIPPGEARDEDGVDAEAGQNVDGGDEEQQVPDYSGWDGREALKDAYNNWLTDEERARSIRALAPRLAAVTRLSKGTVRVYLGEYRQELRASQEGVAAPGNAGTDHEGHGETAHAAAAEGSAPRR
jgi:hypothetical protein